jgi:vancomycin resistance protein YoaR
VSDLTERVTRDSENATFSADENGAIIVTKQEQPGLKLDEKASVQLIADRIRSEDSNTTDITLAVETVQPTIVASDRDRLGLKELVGQGKTNFKGSTKNRIYNINRALQQFQGALIAPGETFSFVTVLGEVDGEHGYLPELVIKDNQTLPEFGGGICQVSTTAFRAAINTGLKIVERRNHAYPVHYYYPYGMDATVYVPKPDLRFTNNTPGYILMQSSISGTELTFNFFGSKDGRTVKIDGPHILESNPDGSMKTVFSQLVTDASGEEIVKDSFWSNYKSPSLFPHPGEEIIKEKPAGWSKREWDNYKKIHP